VKKILLLLTSFGLLLSSHVCSASALQEAIHDLQVSWAKANYKTPEDQLENVFEALNRRAESVVERFPGQAEPLIWSAIIISTDAGKNGGFSALGKVKKSRELLLEAEKINAKALDGSIYTSLGSLYYQVPGWPIGFGDNEQAEKYLKQALALNPNGIDSNYFYADFLLDEGRYKEAVAYFTKALNAPARPNRHIADQGRREEARTKLKLAKNNVGAGE